MREHSMRLGAAMTIERCRGATVDVIREAFQLPSFQLASYQQLLPQNL